MRHRPTDALTAAPVGAVFLVLTMFKLNARLELRLPEPQKAGAEDHGALVADLRTGSLSLGRFTKRSSAASIAERSTSLGSRRPSHSMNSACLG